MELAFLAGNGDSNRRTSLLQTVGFAGRMSAVAGTDQSRLEGSGATPPALAVRDKRHEVFARVSAIAVPSDTIFLAIGFVDTPKKYRAAV
jgi:hypothetical protein